MMQRRCLLTLAFAVILGPGLPVYAQGQDANSTPPPADPAGGWKKFGEPRNAYGEPASSGAQAPSGAPAVQRPAPLPSQITVPAGTWITVRVNQPLSSDHNQPGDAFTATLAQPVVVDGRVLAHRGQMAAGRVDEVEKAGHVKGTSRLGLELTELGLADGQQVPIKTQFVERRGNTSVGNDAGAIAATTGVGAAIGAAADGGFGAGMGAIAGAAASTIGVLVTRGRSTVVYPEMVLTFRLENPVVVNTQNSEAFVPVSQQDYNQRAAFQDRPAPRVIAGPPAPYYPYPYYYYGPGYFGPSFFFYSGPRFYGHRGYYRRW